MASQVEVRGGGDFDGAILQNAASEATLLRLVAAMEARSPGSGAAARELASQQRNTRAVDQSTQAVRSSTQETGRFSQAMKEAAGSLSTFVSVGLQSAFGFLNRGLETFRQTSAVGAAFNNSIFDLATAAAESNMSMEDLAQQIQKNSLLFSTFGGTVTQGAKAFGLLSESLRQDMGERFYGMGLTVRDLNDYLGAYLETEMRFGRLRGRSNKELIASASAYVLELEQMSKLTGVSRRSMEEQMRASSLDPFIAELMEREGANESQSTANLALMKDLAGGSTELQDAIKEIAAGMPTSDMAVNLAQRLSPQQARDLILGNGDVFSLLGPALQGMGDILSRFSAAQIQADPYLQSLQRLKRFGRTLGERSPEDIARAKAEQDNLDFITTKLGAASDAFNRIKNSLLAAFLKSDMFKNFLTGIENLSDWVEKNSPKLIDGLGKLFSPVSNWFKTSFKDVADLFEKGEYQEAFNLMFPKIFEGIGNILTSTFETISDFLIYLWTGELPDRLLGKLNSVSNSLGRAFEDPQARREPRVQQFNKDSFKFSGIGSMFSDMFSGLNFNFDTSGLFSGIIESFKGLKATLNEKDVGGKSILEWFTEFKDLFLKIPEILTVAESKISSLMTMFSSFGGGSGGGGGTISNIKDIVDGLNKLTTWFDNLSVSQILKAQLLVSTLTPLTSSMGGGGGSIDFSALTTTLDAVTRLVDRIDKVDVNKFKELMATISPLFTMFAGSGIASMLGGGSNDQTSFVEKIDKTIQLLDKLEKFNTGPITELNTQFKQAYATTNDFVGLREEAVGFVNELAGAIENLTKKMDELVEAIPSGTELLGQATGATDLYNWFKGDGSAGNSGTPASNEPGMLDYLKELVGINQDQKRELQKFNRDRMD